MDNTNITFEESLYFIIVNIVLLFIGVFLWYHIWIKNYGGEIPNPQMENESNLTFFNSKNFKIVVKELYKRLRNLDKVYMSRSVGIEAYVYLLFQRRMCSLIFSMASFSIFFSVLTFLSKIKSPESSRFFDFFINNKYIDNFSTVIHIVSLFVFTFLHFRNFSIIKREAQYIYFDRFDKMSRKKDSDWLSCRTLHISGMGPNDRNINALKKKLDLFLSNQEGGRVIDVRFIPDYKTLLKLEIKVNEMNDIKNLISKKETDCARRLFFPAKYRTEAAIKKELEKLENEIQETTKKPVYSSGHAFVCFDSLLSAYKCLNSFEDMTYRKIAIQINSLLENLSKKTKRRKTDASTFQQFHDEDLESAMMDPDKLDILVDQMIEPVDIVWTNIGGGRGIYMGRKIICFLVIFIILIFLTTPTAMFSQLKSMDYFSLLEFKWIIKIPYGYILKTYIPPFIILMLNLILLNVIDMLANFESHYTHSRYQLSVFVKGFFYMMLNLFIIPGITLTTTESLFNIIYDKIYDIPALISKIYLSNSGFFFITLVIQNGTITAIFYLLRLDEIFLNSFSSFIAYYRRYFTNNGKPWHRSEVDVFQFGYFYALILTIYTINLVFSTTIPFICPTALYFFFLKHISDGICLLTVHREEIDSSGKIINKILNYSWLPVVIYHSAMISFFLVNRQYTPACITIVLLLISIVYSYFFHSKYVFDIYSLHEKLKVYEHTEEKISSKEINFWRNKFRHPLVIPLSISEENSLIEDSENRDHRRRLSLRSKNLNEIKIDRSSDSLSQLHGANQRYSLQIEN